MTGIIRGMSVINKIGFIMFFNSKNGVPPGRFPQLSKLFQKTILLKNLSNFRSTKINISCVNLLNDERLKRLDKRVSWPLVRTFYPRLKSCGTVHRQQRIPSPGVSYCKSPLLQII